MLSYNELYDKVNNYIDNMSYNAQPEGLYAPIKYVLSLGGKRIRPILMLMAYNLYHEEVDDILPNAIALETYHNFTLLHDDLMDRADMRRGNMTVHKKWDDNTAILSGDAMLIMAYKLFTESNDVREEEYMEMIRLKTSLLLACALKIGAELADASEEDAENLYQFGEKMGLAFQLQDDLLDVYGDPAVFGKQIGGDILCNKKTFMLINAFNMANAEQKSQLKEWISKTDFVPAEKIKAVTAIYDAVGIKEVCNHKIESLFTQALQYLSSVNIDESKKGELKAFANRLLKRNK